jgi:hypothetical protein
MTNWPLFGEKKTGSKVRARCNVREWWGVRSTTEVEALNAQDFPPPWDSREEYQNPKLSAKPGVAATKDI